MIERHGLNTLEEVFLEIVRGPAGLGKAAQ